MDLAAIRNACRVLMDDEAAPYMVADSTLDEFINQAEMEAADRAQLIVDSTTADTSRIEVSAGSREYPLDSRVLDVLRVTLPSVHKPLDKLGYKALDDLNVGWGDRVGSPNAYALDQDVNTVYLSHIPETTETMSLTVVRLPMNKMVAGEDKPEIAEQYHYDLVYWALSLVYQIRDSDLFDLDASARYESKFERRFGPRMSAWERERNKRAYRRRSKAHFL